MSSSLIRRVLYVIEGLRRRELVAISLAMLLGLIALDLTVGFVLSLTMLYLIPITLCTWYVSGRVGQLLTATAAVAWLADGIIAEISLPVTLWNAGVRLLFFLLFIHLLTTLRDSYERERSLARSDPLTGVFNRRAFHDLLAHELARMRRITLPLTVAYLDLDNFKAINDLLGHSSGDQLLIRLTTVMRENLRTIDQVARVGGDEFVILMPSTSAPAAEVALGRLQRTAQEAMRLSHWPVTLSIGAVSFYEPPESIDQVIGLADHTMYMVKKTGKNNVQVIAWGEEQARARGR